jgi:aquaporin Z
VIPPLAIGSVLMVMIYAGGHVSGAHFNPAVTVGVFLRGRCTASDVVPYWVAQLIGAFAAAAIVLFFKTKVVVAFDAPVATGFLAEFLFTFALVYVILNVATARATNGNSYFGLAIGFTVLAGAFAVGDISGGAFNPAVAVGAMTMGMLAWSKLWLYVVAELLGAAAAAGMFKAINPEDR